MEEKFGISTKKRMLDEVKKRFSESRDMVVTSYKGLSALDMDTLRKDLKKASSRYMVVKNSIACRILEEEKLEDLKPYIKGETGLGFLGDIVAASKVLAEFSKKNPAFKLDCAYFSGKIESADRVTDIAKLPPKDVMLCILLGYLKGPITSFVGVLSGLLRGLAHAIDEIKNKKAKEENNG